MLNIWRIDMTLEATLTKLGNDPILKVPNHRAVLAYMNGNFSKVKIDPIDEQTPSDKVLEKIYAMDDLVLQSLILNRPVTELGNDHGFKNILLGSAVLLTIIIVMVTLISIFSSEPLAPETVGLFKEIGLGVLEIVKTLVTQNPT